jgi:hypothetical protein
MLMGCLMMPWSIPYCEQLQWSAQVVQHHYHHPPPNREIQGTISVILFGLCCTKFLASGAVAPTLVALTVTVASVICGIMGYILFVVSLGM